MLIKRCLLLFLCSVSLSACVSNKAVWTNQPGDQQKSCGYLKAELESMGVKFEEAKKDSGVTINNVGMAIVFWPGVIINEITAENNRRSINDRIQQLTVLYKAKCVYNNK